MLYFCRSSLVAHRGVHKKNESLRDIGYYVIHFHYDACWLGIACRRAVYVPPGLGANLLRWLLSFCNPGVFDI
jgi:hypothetical protein